MLSVAIASEALHWILKLLAAYRIAPSIESEGAMMRPLFSSSG